MVRKNIATALKLPGKELELVYTHRDVEYNPSNKSMAAIHVLRGWKRVMKTSRKKWHDKEVIPLNDIYAYPGGIQGLLNAPERVCFICTLRKQCQQDLYERLKKAEKENLEEYKHMSKKLVDLQEELIEKKQELADMRKDFNKKVLELEQLRRRIPIREQQPISSGGENDRGLPRPRGP